MNLVYKLFLILFFILLSYLVYYLTIFFTNDPFLINSCSYFFIAMILFILIIP